MSFCARCQVETVGIVRVACSVLELYNDTKVFEATAFVLQSEDR